MPIPIIVEGVKEVAKEVVKEGIKETGKKAIEEFSKKIDSIKPTYEDSNRPEMEMPDFENVQDLEPTESNYYPDSNRESSDGPQWEEKNDNPIETDEKDDISLNESDEKVGEESTKDNVEKDDTENVESQKENSQDINENLKSDESQNVIESNEEKITSELTEVEKQLIKEETGWSDEIIDCIENMDQYEIYKNADLHEAVIDGRKCLIKDIDMDYVDPKTGMTNRELMEKGRSPIDSKTGEKIELHHMGQNYDSPLVELCENSEHGDGNHSILHTKFEDSWRNNSELKNQYNNVDKPNHWKERAKEA